MDDNEFNVYTLKALLEVCGYKPAVDIAHNGQQAVETVMGKKRSEGCTDSNCLTYRVIFMDCNMPIMDGFEATRVLKKRIKNNEIPDMKIIACTALHEGKYKKKCLEAGMDYYLAKPIH